MQIVVKSYYDCIFVVHIDSTYKETVELWQWPLNVSKELNIQ